jgi:prevent-host-death family protein
MPRDPNARSDDIGQRHEAIHQPGIADPLLGHPHPGEWCAGQSVEGFAAAAIGTFAAPEPLASGFIQPVLHDVGMAAAWTEPRPLDSVGLPGDDDLSLAAGGDLAHQRLKLDALFRIGPSHCRLYPFELPEIHRPHLLRSTDYPAIRPERNVNLDRFHTQVELRLREKPEVLKWIDQNEQGFQMKRPSPQPGSLGDPPNRWDLQNAKANLSELVRRVKSHGPQHVTVHGRDEVVVISVDDFQRLNGRNRPIAYRCAPVFALM